MKLSRTIGLTVAVSLVAGAVAALGQIGGAAAPADPTANVVDAAGHLRVPADYRTLYQALGSWAIATDSGQGSKEMHTVYASPGAIDAYRKTGHFPDGAVLVKEVFATSTKENPGPVVGLEGVAAVRAAIALPLVAIGGITLERAPEVYAAGAASLAVISDLLREDPATMVRRFLMRIEPTGRPRVV